MTARLVVAEVSKSFGDHVALRDVSLSVEAGRIVALVGHNGAGKTTLLRVVAGLLDPTSGSVTVDGLAAGSLEARGLVSFIPDAPVLYEDLSLYEQAEYVARLHGVEDWAFRADQLIEGFGLTERRDDLPARFSRGMRQKASVVLGLVRPFGVLLVDEPFVGLDTAGKAAFMSLLVDAQADGAAILVSTHQPDLLRIADRCIVLEDGIVVDEGPPGSVGYVRDGFVAEPDDDD